MLTRLCSRVIRRLRYLVGTLDCFDIINLPPKYITKIRSVEKMCSRSDRLGSNKIVA